MTAIFFPEEPMSEHKDSRDVPSALINAILCMILGVSSKPAVSDRRLVHWGPRPKSRSSE